MQIVLLLYYLIILSENISKSIVSQFLTKIATRRFLKWRLFVLDSFGRIHKYIYIGSDNFTNSNYGFLWCTYLKTMGFFTKSMGQNFWLKRLKLSIPNQIFIWHILIFKNSKENYNIHIRNTWIGLVINLYYYLTYSVTGL